MSDDLQWLEHDRSMANIGNNTTPTSGKKGNVQPIHLACTSPTPSNPQYSHRTSLASVPQLSASNGDMDYFYLNYQQFLKQSPFFNQYQNITLNTPNHITVSPDMGNSTSSQSSNPHIIVPDPHVEEVEVISSNKKRRAIARGKRKCTQTSSRRLNLDGEDTVQEVKGVPNKRWDQPASDYALEVLAELAKEGFKVDKSFKRQAFVNCAKAVNEKFSECYTPENVSNHLRTLKTKWNHINFIRNLSGAGFDDEEKMIILEGKVLEDFKLSHPNLMVYVNKPIKGFELMRIVAGEDQATGSFRKVIYQSFGSTPIPTTTSASVDIEGVAANANYEIPTPGSQRGSTFGVGPRGLNSQPSRSESDTVSGSGRKRGPKDAALDAIVEKMGDMTSVIVIAQKERTDEKMSDALFRFEEFDMEVLDKAFERLYHDPEECKKFNARPNNAKKMWLEKFKATLEQGGGSQ